MTDEIAKALRNISEDGFIGFSIKAKNTDDHSVTHMKFRNFAREQCFNDYTLALKTLLAKYQTDSAEEALWMTIGELKADIIGLQEQLKNKEKKQDDRNTGTF